MTITQALSNAKSRISNVYSVLESKGASMPVSRNLENMASTIEGLPTGGGDFDALIERTLTEVSGSASVIGDYAFFYYASLQSANFPNCISIRNSAFYGCTSLQSISFPNCNSIGVNVFRYCSSLRAIDLPMISYIDSSYFASCYFQTVNFPVCSFISSGAFIQCSELQTLSFPACETIGHYAFQSCVKLQEINFPVCSVVYFSAFGSCSSLKTVSLPFCCNLYSNVFSGCTSLESIYLKAFSIVLSSSTAIPYGDIYVQSEKLDYFKASTNWSLISSRIFPLDNDGDAIYPFEYYSSTIASIPESKTSARAIGSNAFAGCSLIESVSLPLCSYILSNAFWSCSSLKEIYIPNCLHIKGGYYTRTASERKGGTFSGCVNLEIIRADACTSIGSYATFSGCTKLSEIYINNSVCSIGQSTFTGATTANLKVYVPSEYVDLYKSSQYWSSISAKIFGYDFSNETPV